MVEKWYKRMVAKLRNDAQVLTSLWLHQEECV